MQFSENQIGYSTGAIAKGDFRAALNTLRKCAVRAVEISTLRREELPILLAAFDGLDLSAFDYISVHAPSRSAPGDEPQLIKELESLPSRCRWIVVHPDVIANFDAWRAIAPRLAIENMDTRKRTGRTAAEMNAIFARLPDAKMCLDLAHSEKVDPTMYEAREMIRRFRDRIVQVHLSEIATDSSHHRLTMLGLAAARRVAKLIPPEVTVIVESPVDGSHVKDEAERARQLFHPALTDLKKDIDGILTASDASPVGTDRARLFFEILRQAGIAQDDIPNAIARLADGGPVARGQVFVTARDLYASLTDTERADLDSHYRELLDRFRRQHPAVAGTNPDGNRSPQHPAAPHAIADPPPPAEQPLTPGPH